VFWRPDIVLTVAPAFVCAPAGWLTARLCGAQAWLHLQDFEIDVAFRLGLLKSPRLQRLVLAMERFVMRRFDWVSSISQRMVEALLEKGVSNERARLFPNWVDTEHIVPSTHHGAYRTQLKIASDAIVVLFSGTLGAKQGLMLIPAVARILANRKEVVFVICGDGVMKPELEAASAGRANLRMLPLQPAEKLSELLSMADIHLLPQSPGAADLVMPSKLSGMLASGRPVIATCHAGTEIDAVVSQCGVVVPPEDSEATADAILRLVEEPGMRHELGRRARIWAECNLERNSVLSRAFGGAGRHTLSDEFEQAVKTDPAA
jgi:colanic acid biosynthesis glycosyl transferase WcaI